MFQIWFFRYFALTRLFFWRNEIRVAIDWWFSRDDFGWLISVETILFENLYLSFHLFHLSTYISYYFLSIVSYFLVSTILSKWYLFKDFFFPNGFFIISLRLDTFLKTFGVLFYLLLCLCRLFILRKYALYSNRYYRIKPNNQNNANIKIYKI